MVLDKSYRFAVLRDYIYTLQFILNALICRLIVIVDKQIRIENIFALLSVNIVL